VYLSLSYVTEGRNEGRGKEGVKGRIGFFPYSPSPFPPPTPFAPVGWLTCVFVFVTVSKAQRYFDTALLTLYIVDFGFVSFICILLPHNKGFTMSLELHSQDAGE
jgi:hypothetical protein